jgi:phosphate transport system substrate-binding protein
MTLDKEEVNMKKGILIVLGLVLLVLLAFTFASKNKPTALTGVVKTGGSTSVEKVMNSLIYQFQLYNRDVRIDYEMNGSGDGIKSTLSGLYEIGHSSRDLKTDGSESGLKAIPYAIDGIAIVVNKDNPVENLTKEELFGIYTGKITNWSDVGGKDALITVVSREKGSGTRSAFSEIVGLDLKERPETAQVTSATITDSTGAVQTTVMQNPNAIGYMSFSDVDRDKVKTVSYNGVEISEETLRSDTYKLKRTFLMVVKEGAELSGSAQAFLDFVLSDEGQKIVAANNLIPVK